MASKRKIGFIGLGHMGLPMAGRLVEVGHDVTVYNRSESKAKSLLAKGARLAHAPSELSDRDIIYTMLADDGAVNEVVNGPNGFAKNFKAGGTHITSSTISVELSRKLEAQHKSAGQRYLAAPVLGRPDAAQAGKLFVLAAGAHSEDTDAILSAIGQKVFSIPGEAWHANLIKIACNFMLMSAIETMSESFAMVRKGGIEPQIFFEIFSDTLFSAPVYKNYGAMIVK
jgi:3-hydroxyisobutyrate dehydrogenase-like beta-hydroxyacid dehydrogenase